MKRLKDISWQVSEPEYRKDKSLSYSQLKTYESKGFEELFNYRPQTESLLFGSVVDTIITDGMDVFMQKYTSLPLHVSFSLQTVLTKIATTTQNKCERLTDIPIDVVVKCAKECEFGGTWNDNMIYKKIVNDNSNIDFSMIVRQLQQNPNKTIISTKLYEDVCATVSTLKNNITTKWYFTQEADGIDREYQLKFKNIINDVPYRCMADLILVDHKNKQIIPCDLKTTGVNERAFWDSFHKFWYFYQAKLYYYLIKQALLNDDYFKDFELLPYRFIVINKTHLNPMIYGFSDLDIDVDYTYNNITYRPITKVGPELYKLFKERNKQMNEKLAVEAIDEMCEGLHKLKNAFLDLMNKPQNKQENNESKTIATIVAKTYKTKKAFLGVEALYKDLYGLAMDKDKIGILLAWVDSSKDEYVQTFKTYPLMTKTKLLQEAIKTHTDLIKQILTARYEYDK